MEYEYHVAYWLGPDLVSGINVTAENYLHAVREAMINTTREPFILHYIHNKTTNQISERHDRYVCSPIIKR